MKILETVIKNEIRKRLKEATEIDFPKSNFSIVKIDTDTNGNKTLYLKNFEGKSFRIQTNGNLPEVHRKYSKNDFSRIVKDKKAMDEIKSYAKEFFPKLVKFY